MLVYILVWRLFSPIIFPLPVMRLTVLFLWRFLHLPVFMSISLHAFCGDFLTVHFMHDLYFPSLVLG